MSSDPSFPPGSPLDPAPETPVDPVTPTPLPAAPLGDATTTPLAPATLQTGDTGLPANVAAGLAVLFVLLGGIAFILLEKRNQFVRFWAMQSIYFGAAWIVFSIGVGIVGVILGHIFWLLAGLWHLAGWLAYLGFVIVWVIMLIQAFSGKEWEVPYLGKLARQQLAKPPVVMPPLE